MHVPCLYFFPNLCNFYLPGVLLITCRRYVFCFFSLFLAIELTSSTIHACVFSNSRNDVPRVAQRYGTIAAHTRRRASVLVVFVVFCVHMHSFPGLIRRTPPPTFSDIAITDRHSDTTIFQLRAHWVRTAPPSDSFARIVLL